MSKSSPKTTDLIRLGKIVAAHGIKGQVTVEPATNIFERFAKGNLVFINSTEDRISSSRQNGFNIILGLSSITDRNAAEALIGTDLFGHNTSLHFPADTYQVTDLIGCAVVNDQRESVGQVTNVLDLPAGDVLEVGKILIPFRKEFVKKVDIQQRLIEVSLLEGMIEEAKL